MSHFVVVVVVALVVVVVGRVVVVVDVDFDEDFDSLLLDRVVLVDELRAPPPDESPEADERELDLVDFGALAAAVPTAPTMSTKPITRHSAEACLLFIHVLPPTLGSRRALRHSRQPGA